MSRVDLTVIDAKMEAEYGARLHEIYHSGAGSVRKYKSAHQTILVEVRNGLACVYTYDQTFFPFRQPHAAKEPTT